MSFKIDEDINVIQNPNLHIPIDNIYLDSSVVNRLLNSCYQIPKDALLELAKKVLSLIIKNFSEDQKYMILEMGIGTGKIGIPMALYGEKYNTTVYGFDNSKAMVAILNNLLIKKHIPNLKYIFADAEAPYLSFQDKTFHACFMVYFLHHINDWQKCIEETTRILKSNGIIIFMKEVSQWTYFIDANFNLTELGIFNDLLFRFWSYYHHLREGIVKIPCKINSRLFSATNYTNVLKYLKGKGMKCKKIKMSQKMKWKRKVNFKRILEIIRYGDYPILAMGLTKSQRAYLADRMEIFLKFEEIDLNEEIEIDSWIEADSVICRY